MNVLNRILTVSEENITLEAVDTSKSDHHAKMATRHTEKALALGATHKDFQSHINAASDHIHARLMNDQAPHTGHTLRAKANSAAANKASKALGISLESVSTEDSLENALESLADAGSPVLTRMQQAAVSYHHSMFEHHREMAMGTDDSKLSQRHLNASASHLKAMHSHVHQKDDRLKHSDEAETKTSTARQKHVAMGAIGESVEDELDSDLREAAEMHAIALAAESSNQMVKYHRDLAAAHGKKTGQHHVDARKAHEKAMVAHHKGQKNAMELTKSADEKSHYSKLVDIK